MEFLRNQPADQLLTHGDMRILRAELRAEVAELRGEIVHRQTQTLVIIGIVANAFAVVIALLT